MSQYDDTAYDDAGGSYEPDLEPDYEPAATEPVDARWENVVPGEQVARVKSPSGFDYVNPANRDVRVSDVMAAQQELAQMPAEPDDEQYFAELDAELEAEEQQEAEALNAARAQALSTLAYAAEHPNEAWDLLRGTQIAAEEARLVQEFKQASAEAARPFTEAAQANLAVEQERQTQDEIDAVADGWLEAGLSEAQVQTAWDEANTMFEQLVEGGYPADRATAEWALNTVGAQHQLKNAGVQLVENWRGEFVPKPRRYNETRPHIDAREAGSITARFARAGAFNDNRR